ncbi:hypothetical protein BV133_1306 [Blastochloris viridis]|nr:hypothetical protein BV133_1306 [Blastochloris viridis]
MIAVLPAAGSAAAGDSKVIAQYEVTLAGIEIGKAAFVVDINANTFTTVSNAKVTGVAQIVAEGKGRAGARGTLVKDKLQPGSFALTADSDSRHLEIQFGFDKAGAVKNLQVTPTPQPRPDRLEVTDAHRRNVLDPMSATLFAVPGTGDVIGPEACNRVLPIFDGVARYDLTLSYARQDTVAAKGFSGTAVVCQVAFKAVAGHRLGRKDIEYMEANNDISVWLVPVAGSRVLVPFRISVATKVGTCVIEAKSFSTQHTEARAAVPAEGGTAR